MDKFQTKAKKIKRVRKEYQRNLNIFEKAYLGTIGQFLEKAKKNKIAEIKTKLK